MVFYLAAFEAFRHRIIILSNTEKELLIGRSY